MTIKWTIEKLKTTGDTNVVTHVYWRCENGQAACAGVCDLILGDTFTAYDQLTEQQVLGWVFTPKVTELKDADGNVVETITRDFKAEAEAEVSALLAQQNVGPTLPW
tara:strand:- start:149 stop:469 length:321 start_codon:yes stop_codon:yes gene_type:complete